MVWIDLGLFALIDQLSIFYSKKAMSMQHSATYNWIYIVFGWVWKYMA